MHVVGAISVPCTGYDKNVYLWIAVKSLKKHCFQKGTAP